MSPPDTQSDGPTTDAEFQEALNRLISASQANGVDVTGGWQMRGAEGPTDYGIEIYRVTKPGRRSHFTG